MTVTRENLLHSYNKQVAIAVQICSLMRCVIVDRCVHVFETSIDYYYYCN